MNDLADFSDNGDIYSFTWMVGDFSYFVYVYPIWIIPWRIYTYIFSLGDWYFSYNIGEL